MKPLTQQKIEDYNKLKWFVMHHYDNCSICGKKFGFNENSYFGHLEDGSYAYTCEKCSQQMIGAQFLMGMYYLKGEGVDSNPEIGVHWLRLWNMTMELDIDKQK